MSLPAAYPCFLDVEASGFGSESYPIEVAWSLPDGEIVRCLIDVSDVPSWTYWDPAAEAVHGIDRDRLVRNGWSVAYVAERLRADLGGRSVYTDAPTFDQAWLERLFCVAGGEHLAGDDPPAESQMPFVCEHIDELLLAELRRPDEAIWQTLQRIDAMKQELNAVRDGKHSAGYDVGYLLALWRHAGGAPIKMHHGVGPMPVATSTGTFLRVKLRE
jgi:hypothetical protein